MTTIYTAQPNHERNPLEELSALADEEGEQIEEEKEKSPRIEASRGEIGGIVMEDPKKIEMEKCLESEPELKFAGDESDDSLEELLDELSDGKDNDWSDCPGGGSDFCGVVLLVHPWV